MPVVAHSTFRGELSFSGELAVSGSFTDTLTTRGETCRAYVSGVAPATTLWVVPTPSNAELVDRHIVTYTAGVVTPARGLGTPPARGYHGPGVYSGSNAIAADLTIDNYSFIGDAQTSATIVVNSSGAGSMSFRGMVDTFSSARESGTVTWRCAG